METEGQGWVPVMLPRREPDLDDRVDLRVDAPLPFVLRWLENWNRSHHDDWSAPGTLQLHETVEMVGASRVHRTIAIPLPRTGRLSSTQTWLEYSSSRRWRTVAESKIAGELRSLAEYEEQVEDVGSFIVWSVHRRCWYVDSVRAQYQGFFARHRETSQLRDVYGTEASKLVRAFKNEEKFGPK